jgi:hypothetical protein
MLFAAGTAGCVSSNAAECVWLCVCTAGDNAEIGQINKMVSEVSGWQMNITYCC